MSRESRGQVPAGVVARKSEKAIDMRGTALETQARQEDNFPMVAVSEEDAYVVRRYQRLFSIYLSFVAFVTLCYGVLDVMEKNEWVMGDWLINYRGGFVRRGLPGEIALRAGHLLHLSPMHIVLVLQVLTYVAMFYSVWRLLARTSWSAWVLVMVVSPATLAFQVLDPLAGLRKDEILLGGLGMLLVFLLDRKPSAPWPSLYLTVLGVGCVLSHEALIFFVPYLFAAMAIGLERSARSQNMCDSLLGHGGLRLRCGAPHRRCRDSQGNLLLARACCHNRQAAFGVQRGDRIPHARYGKRTN